MENKTHPNSAGQAVQLNMGEFQTLMQNVIGSVIKELGLTKVDRKHGIFPGAVNETELLQMTKEQRLNLFLRTILSKNPSHQNIDRIAQEYQSMSGEGIFQKALSEGTDADGGYLVPEEFRAEVVRVAEDYGWVRKNAFVFPTDSDTLNLTSEVDTVAVGYTNELAQITHDQPVFGRPVISVKKLAGITSLSNELFADSKFPLVTYLTTIFAEAIAGAEDTQGLVGTGSPFTGLLNAGTVITTATENTFENATTPDNLLTVIFSLAEKYRKGARFVMHPTVYSYLLKKKASGSGEYHMVQPGTGTQPPTVWSYPVDFSEKMPSSTALDTKYILFCNPKRLWFADRQQLTVALATEGTVNDVNLFEKDARAIRVTERHGMVVTPAAGVAVLKTAAS
ncbi:MAG: phage major capsid protein [Ignavibacteriae bacterium]|nr:phage major capsid protein [Ignavibacteriota bacterium]